MTADCVANEAAEASLKAQDWDQAVKHLNRAIEAKPSDPTLFAKRATAFLEMGPLCAFFAAQDASIACVLDPSFVQGYLLFSKANLLDGALFAAEIGVRRGLLLYPEDASLLSQLKTVKQARMEPNLADQVSIRPIWDSPDEYGFVYTHGLFYGGLPELLMVDVPRDMIPTTLKLLEMVVSRLVQDKESLVHGEIIKLDDHMRLQVLTVSEDANRMAMIEMVGQWTEQAEITLLKLIDDEHPPEPKDRQVVIPPAPKDQNQLLQSVLDKWRTVDDSFTYFVDGNQKSTNVLNRMPVPLSYLLPRCNEKVNWDSVLTNDEREFVSQHWRACMHHVRADLLGVGYGLDGRYIRTVARRAAGGPILIETLYKAGVQLASSDDDDGVDKDQTEDNTPHK